GLGNPARRQSQGIAAGKDDLPDLRTRPQVVERPTEFGRAQRPGSRADTLAAETETAIDRANRDQLDEDTIGVAMHKPPGRAPGIVADRIVAFGGIADEFTRIRHELAGD